MILSASPDHARALVTIDEATYRANATVTAANLPPRLVQVAVTVTRDGAVTHSGQLTVTLHKAEAMDIERSRRFIARCFEGGEADPVTHGRMLEIAMEAMRALLAERWRGGR